MRRQLRAALTLVSVVLLLGGCQVGVPSVPDADDELAGVVTRSGDTPLLGWERGASGDVLMLPADLLDDLFADQSLRAPLDRRPLPQATQSVVFPAQRIRDTADTRVVELRRGRFAFDGVAAEAVVLCLLDEAGVSAPPDSVVIRGCVEIDADPPASVKLMLADGLLDVADVEP